MKKSLVIIFIVLILSVVVAIWGMLYIKNKGASTVSTIQPARQEAQKKVTSTATKVTSSTLKSSKVVNSTRDLSKGYISLLGNITSISKDSLVLYSKGESLIVKFDPDCHVSKMGDNSQVQRATIKDVHNGDRVNIYCKITKEGNLIAAGIHILPD